MYSLYIIPNLYELYSKSTTSIDIYENIVIHISKSLRITFVSRDTYPFLLPNRGKSEKTCVFSL